MYALIHVRYIFKNLFMPISRSVALTISCAVVVALGFGWYNARQASNNTAHFELSTPTQRTLEQFVKASGTLKAKEQLVVGSLVNGRVVEWYADANDVVEKNDVLARLDDGIGYASVEKTLAIVAERTADLDRAQQLFERYSVLLQSNALQQDEYDKQKYVVSLAQARLQQAKADLKMSQRRYEDMSIKAPDSGTVIARKVDVGQMVTAQLQATELFVIAKDLHHMEATIDVDEADIGLVKPGQEAFFVVDAFPTKEFKARVIRVENLAKTSGTVISYSVILNVENPDLTLRPGMTTNVQITVAKKDNALSIPQRALRLSRTGIQTAVSALKMTMIENEDAVKPSRLYKSYVWVKDGNTVKQVQVSLGVSNAEFIEIAHGLSEQNQVITGITTQTQENEVIKRFGPKSPVGGK